MRSSPPYPAVRPRIGEAAELRRRLAPMRRRPLLVRAYAGLLGEEGLAGASNRRRLARFALRSVPALVAVGFGALLSLRVFADALGLPEALAVAALLATLGAVAWRRASRGAAGQPATAREHVELGSLFVVAAYTVAQTAGGPTASLDGPLYPVVYLVMAFLVAFLPRGAGLGLVGFAVAVDLAILGREGAQQSLPAAAAHAGFIVLFAVLYHAVLAAQVTSGRRMQRAAVARRLREIEERAREFRLISPSSNRGEDQRERFTAASVVEIEAAVRGALEVAEVALRSHTCAVFLISPDDKQLVLRECRSRSDQVTRRALSAAEGPLGVAVKRKAPVRLCGDLKTATYYDDGRRPKSLLAVPLVDRRGDHVRGVLLADRLEAEGFSDSDEQILQRMAAELLRAIASERLMNDMKRSRDEKERFYEAMERLNRLTKPREVFDGVLEVARDIVPVDFGAVTLVERREDDKPFHKVCRAVGQGDAEPKVSAALEGLEFGDNHGLVASAVKLAASLPAKDLKPADAVVFDPATRLKGLGSIKVFPLKAGENVLGTLVLGSKRRGVFDGEVTRMLEVIALQAGESILRARLFEKTEKMATTDGLTGLVNHRTFQQRMDEALAASLRYGKKLSMVLTDIDHFKSVNDTYGHPVGDLVLKGVAQIIQKEARTTDVVARYGGEEFAIVMPETDEAGALVTCERIRKAIEARVFDTELGPLKVTLSLGIATCPDDARAKAALVELADGCLYHAKRHGRNQTVTATQAKTGKRASA